MAIGMTVIHKNYGNLRIYKLIDTVSNIEDLVIYPVEFLNSLDLPGFSPHDLQLKNGVAILVFKILIIHDFVMALD